jgi:succinate dehydrogenase/fumarate reductase-like Fe-S protein
MSEIAETTFVPIYVMGKRYDVPEGMTIMKAIEWAGYRLVRGVGCRAGFCGACATVYRLKGDHRLHFNLACQTVVQGDMILTQIPFFPAPRAAYQLGQLSPTPEQLYQVYPEILRCLACGTCTKACPQDLDVMDYMASAMRGDIAATASKSFDCIMCGLCAARCPVGEAQYNVAILARRLYGRYLSPPSAHLEQRIADISAGVFDAELAELKGIAIDELKRRYAQRSIEE